MIRIAFIDKQRSWTGQTKRTLLVISAIDRTSISPIPVFAIRMDGIQQLPAILRVKRILQANQKAQIDSGMHPPWLRPFRNC